MNNTDEIHIGDRIRYGFSVMDFIGIVAFIKKDRDGKVKMITVNGVEMACNREHTETVSITNINGITIIKDNEVWNKLIKNEPAFNTTT